MPKAPNVVAIHAQAGFGIHGQPIQFRKQLSKSSALIGSIILLRAKFIHMGLSERVVCPDVVVEWLERSLYIVEVPGSHLGREIA